MVIFHWKWSVRIADPQLHIWLEMSACLGGHTTLVQSSSLSYSQHLILILGSFHGLIAVSRTVAWSTSLYGMKPSSLFGVSVLLLWWQKQVRMRAVSYDFDGGSFSILYQDSEARVEMRLKQMEYKEQYFVVNLVIYIAVAKVNKHFRRDYWRLCVPFRFVWQPFAKLDLKSSEAAAKLVSL